MSPPHPACAYKHRKRGARHRTPPCTACTHTHRLDIYMQPGSTLPSWDKDGHDVSLMRYQLGRWLTLTFTPNP